MSIKIDYQEYGKENVRLMKVQHGASGHRVIEYNVEVKLVGDFDDTYLTGDNTAVLPTDTMKNTVYALARKHDFHSPEEFALILLEHFSEKDLPPVHYCLASIEEKPWGQLSIQGKVHPTAYSQATSERRTVQAIQDLEGIISLASGLRDLQILKSTKSAFSDFLRDEYTTLPDAEDRVFGTRLKATWAYTNHEVDHNQLHEGIRDCLLKVFAEHDSLSVQHTLYAMGKAALKEFTEIYEIQLVMPNVHNLPVDLSPFGLENPHEILMPVEEPSGYIEAHLVETSRSSPFDSI